MQSGCTDRAGQKNDALQNNTEGVGENQDAQVARSRRAPAALAEGLEAAFIDGIPVRYRLASIYKAKRRRGIVHSHGLFQP
ncbi:hypothetical protein CT19431_190045 [Cupriavidus taiwanensis]|nr:hypothetical protein CT19431_190045 [Cupriavidus taiwanensis]